MLPARYDDDDDDDDESPRGTTLNYQSKVKKKREDRQLHFFEKRTR